MKKLIITLIILALAVIAYLAMQRTRTANTNDKPTVKIGVMLPLSGDMANFGKPAKGALDVAIKHLSTMDTKYNYEFIVEDNRFDNALSNTILSKLLSVDKIDALLDGGAGVGNITSPLAEKKQIPHINVWSSDGNVAKGKYNFINWTQPDKESQKMAKIIAQKGYKNVWLVAVNHDGPIAMAASLADELSRHNINHDTMKFNFGTRDMRLDIKKMNEKGADLFVLFLFDPEMSIFLKQAKEVGTKAEITSVEVFSFIENPALIEGMWYVDAAEGQGGIADEIKAHNQSNASFGTSNMYDNVMLLVKAFEAAKTK